MVHPADSTKPVLVTGATSFIGSHIIKILLARGHVVRATARDPEAPRLAPVKAFDPTGKKLFIVKADMTDFDSFPAIVEGCRAVIHVATPFEIKTDARVLYETAEEAEEKVVRPAVDGTKALFEAAAAAGVKKIVLTSSLAAMVSTPTPHPVWNEDCWSDEQFSRDNIIAHGVGAYIVQKLLQEKLAHELGEKLGIDVVTICPSFVAGPSIIGTLNMSLECFVSIPKGTGAGLDQSEPGTIPNKFCALVDVREVAMAHVLAVEKDDAEKRYFLLSHAVHWGDVVAVLRRTEEFARLPEIPLGSLQGDGKPDKFDNSKVRALGVEEIPWEETVEETAKSLAAGGYVK